jgi:hypothetical protein
LSFTAERIADLVGEVFQAIGGKLWPSRRIRHRTSPGYVETVFLR